MENIEKVAQLMNESITEAVKWIYLSGVEDALNGDIDMGLTGNEMAEKWLKEPFTP